MNGRSAKIYLLLLFLILPSMLVFSFSFNNNEAKGNKLYQEGKYEDAVKEYTEGLTKKADYTLFYNRGASFFKLGQYDKALSDFENSATYSNSDTGHIRAIYNAGNSSFMKAETDKVKNPSAALQSYEKAVSHFERVLQLDKNNQKAAYNLELGRIRIDELKKQQKDNKQQNQNQQQQGKQDNNQQNQNQQQGQQNNNQQNQNQQQQGKQDNNQQNQNQQQQGKQDNNQQNQQQPGQQSTNQQNLSNSENVSPEDILKEEARRQEAVKLLLSNGSAEPVDKDW